MSVVCVLVSLQGVLNQVRASLDALEADKPAGSPGEMRAVAKRVRAFATEVWDAGGAAGRIPNATAWVGPGADRLRTHTGHAVGEARSIVDELGMIAEDLERQADRLQRELDNWHTMRARFKSQIASLQSDIARLLP